MSRAEGGGERVDALVLAVLADSVVCGAVRGERPLEDSFRRIELDAHDAGGREAALCRALAGLAEATPGGACPMLRVCVSDVWLEALTLPWRDALLQQHGARTCAQAALLEAGCEPEPGETLVVDDAPYQSPRLVLLYPAPLMAALRDFASVLGTELASVRALSTVAATAVAARDPKGAAPAAVVCVVEDGAVSLALHQGHARELLVRRRAATAWGGDDKGMADQLMARQRLRHPSWAAASRQTVVSVATRPEHEALSPGWQQWRAGAEDASASTSSLHPLAWMLSQPVCWRPMALDAIQTAATPRRRASMAGVMALWALPLLWLGQGWSANWQDAAAPVAADAASVGAMRPAADPGQLKRLKALNEAIDVLNAPVSPILQALQPPKDIEAGILSLDFATEPTARKVRIAAESPTSADMLRYVDFVSARPPFEAGRLIHHERMEASAGHGYRYTMELTWRH